MSQPPLPPGQPPPEDIQAFLAAQQHQQAVNEWYNGQLMRLETEARERTLYWAPILCPGWGRCMREVPCPVHSQVHVSVDGRVL